MTDEPSKARRLLEQAHIALQYNDRQAARRLAQQAIGLDPTDKDSWLLLAELSHGNARKAYLEQASRNGLIDVIGETGSNSQKQAQPIPSETSRPKRSYLFIGLTVALVSLTLLVALIGWSLIPIQNTVSAVDHSSYRLAGDLPKPSLTPTDTPESTPTPTVTFTPEPTQTDIPDATPTAASPLIPQVDSPDIPENVMEGERWIDVDLTNQRTYAFEGDMLVRTFIVSTGTQYHPTVTGQYHIYVKYLFADMAGPGYYLPDVPYTMYFYKGYSFHGTYWHDNFGVPMSHGCINMTILDSEWLFNWASVGTLVNIHY